MEQEGYFLRLEPSPICLEIPIKLSTSLLIFWSLIPHPSAGISGSFPRGSMENLWNYRKCIKVKITKVIKAKLLAIELD